MEMWHNRLSENRLIQFDLVEGTQVDNGDTDAGAEPDTDAGIANAISDTGSEADTAQGRDLGTDASVTSDTKASGKTNGNKGGGCDVASSTPGTLGRPNANSLGMTAILLAAFISAFRSRRRKRII